MPECRYYCYASECPRWAPCHPSRDTVTVSRDDLRYILIGVPGWQNSAEAARIRAAVSGEPPPAKHVPIGPLRDGS